MNTWNKVAAVVFKSLGEPERIEYIDMPESIREKCQYYTCADITKLRLAGYDRPLKTLDEATEDYVVNYLVPRKSSERHDSIGVSDIAPARRLMVKARP